MRYINLGILAHVDAGKTTLVEHMLYRSGNLRSPGSIEKGNTQTDRLAIERERGISVRASPATLIYGDVTINIIDTPGHIDFTGEAERALSALDAAVLVVSAAEGVQSQTEIFWQALRTLKLPAVVFINKIDRMGCDPGAVLSELKNDFGGAIVAINAAVASGSRDCAISDTVFTDDEILFLCEHDEKLAAAYLENGERPGADILIPAITRLAQSGDAYPLLFGSAALGVGVRELLDAIITYLPASHPAPEGRAYGVIYKIEHDAALGKIAYTRLFSGILRNRGAVRFIRRGAYVTPGGANIAQGGATPADATPAGAVSAYNADSAYNTDSADNAVVNKIMQIRRISGAKNVDSGVLEGGDAAALIGLADARAGDIIVSGEMNAADGARAAAEVNITNAYHSATDPLPGARLKQLEQIKLTEPLFAVRAYADAGQENKLLRAVGELFDEDPLLEYEWEPDERELILRVMGKIQLEIMETLFLERYNLTVRFSTPTVIYKETPSGYGTGLEEYTMPKPCWAVVRLAVEPRRRGAGYSFESIIKANVLPYRYQHHVELTVPGALKQGLFNWEVVDIKVTLIDGEHHHVHTHPMDFFLATPIAVMKALQDAGTILLEPLTLMRMTAPEELAGRIIGDVTAMRGIYESPVIRNGNITVEALLPVSESIEYPVRFASVTSGKGVIKTSFAGYRECPIELGAAAKRRGVNPLDRMRWILYKRNALA